MPSKGMIRITHDSASPRLGSKLHTKATTGIW